ncbi:hypothetical protein QZH41_009305, partial [Actinostola sp. cb2023]
GDIILGGLFNVHRRGTKSENSCGDLDPNPGYQYFASALFAINEFNNNPNILPGIKLGARIYDTCRSQTIGADGAKELIKYTLQQTKASPPLAGVIGPFRSDVAIAVANLLRVFDIPQVSFGATVVKLSDKDIYSYFFRTVPPNSFQGRALVDVVRYFGWSYVMTVYSRGLYGEPGMDEVYSDAKRKGLCIACDIRLPSFPTTTDYENTIRKLLDVSRGNTASDLNVVVMFCIQRDNTGLVAAAKKILKGTTTRFVWVASNSWGAREPVTNGNEEGGEGALTLNYIEGNVNKFKNYFLNLHYNSINETWFQEFWQISMKCRIIGATKEQNYTDTCSPADKLPPDFGIAPVRVAMNAVYAAVYALNDMHKALCNGTPGMCDALRNLKREVFLKYLRNVSFPDSTSNKTIKFNRNGEVDGRYDVLNFRKLNGKFTYVKVGSWSGQLKDDDSVQGGVQINATLIEWAPTWKSTTPNSYCSATVGPDTLTMTMQSAHAKQNAAELTIEVGHDNSAERAYNFMGVCPKQAPLERVSRKYPCKSKQQAVKMLQKPGDLILGGLFPIHKKSNQRENACGEFDLQPSYQYMTAMLFALEQINNNSALLPNITLGTKIYDSCRSTTIGSDRARDFIKETLFFNKVPLVGVVGPLSSDVSIATAPLLRVFGIPQVSYGSSSSALSNKELYGNFFRTVPPDSFQANAIVDTLQYFGWKYILTISSKGNYGEKGIEELQRAMKEYGICIAMSQSLPYLPTTTDYTNTMREIQQHKHKNVHIIVLFTTQTDSAGLLKAALALKATRFTWFGSSGWSNRMDVIFGKEQIANGSITVNHLGGRVKGFEEFYSSSTTHAHNPWSDEFFGEVLKCNGPHSRIIHQKNCSFNLSMPNIEMSPVRVVINAVYAFAHALHDMQLVTCHREVGLCEAMKTKLRQVELVEYLENTSFPDAVFGFDLKFNKNHEMDGNYSIMNLQQKSDGEWDYVNIGEWGVVVESDGDVDKDFKINVDSVSWGNAPTTPPVSICSSPCAFPLIRKLRLLHPLCCWDCINCKANQFIINDTCQSCQVGYHPSSNLSTCSAIPQVYPDFEGGVGIACVVLAVLGMICTLLTAMFFFKYSGNAVVKASGRELSVIILLGILLCYTAVFPFLFKPSPLTCTVCRYLGSVCYSFCYAPLLMKTIRIYRIFTRGKKSVARPSMVSPTSQLLVTSGLITIQFLITTVWDLSSPPCVKYHYHSLEATILECQTNNFSLACNLSYNIFLMLLCTLFAFKTRGFPRNFNEAKYIGIMMYLTCSIWIIFLPSLLNTRNTYIKVYIRIGSYWTIGTITLVGLFAPKVYIVLFSRDASTSSSNIVASSSILANKDFAIMKKLQNQSSQNQRLDSDVNLLRVDRLYSGHVLGIEGELMRTENGSLCPSPHGSVNTSFEDLLNVCDNASRDIRDNMTN